MTQQEYQYAGENLKARIPFREYCLQVCEVLASWGVQSSDKLQALLPVLTDLYNHPLSTIYGDAETCFTTLQAIYRMARHNRRNTA